MKIRNSITTCIIGGCFWMGVSFLAAQESTVKEGTSSTHLFGGFGLSYPLGATLQAGILKPKDWGAAISFNGTRRPSIKKPSSFDGGHGLLGDWSDNVEPDLTLALGLSTYNLFLLADHRKMSMEVGPSYIWHLQADDFKPVANPCSVTIFGENCSANYTYTRKLRSGPGVYIRGAYHFRIRNFSELSFGLFSHINPVRTYFGVDCMGTVGIFKNSGH